MALSASVVLETGAPKRARNPSPRYLSTIPPCLKTISPMLVKKWFSIATVRWGPIFLERVENPRMSMFRSVRIFSSSISGFSVSGVVDDLVDDLPRNEFLEHVPDAPFVFGHGEGLLVELRVLQGDADRGRDGLEEVEVVVVEIAVDLVEDFDHAEDPSPGDERHAEDRTGPKAGLPVEIG